MVKELSYKRCAVTIKDSTEYLGNNCVVVSDNDSIEQVTHYYPFGAVYADAGLSPGFQKYKYTGKELDLTHGLNTYDHGARQNYSVLGVWDRVDPMCEKYYNVSPYVVCGNNPTRIMDINGMGWIMAHYDSTYFYYYDSRINSQNDVKDNYYKENSYQNIKYLGDNISVYEEKGKERALLFNLNGDGSYETSDIVYNTDTTEWSVDGWFINIGTDILRKGTTNNLGKNNFYGVYLGSNNPKDDDRYVYSVPPIDRLDYSAYLHDRGYDTKNAVGAIGALFNGQVVWDDLGL